MIESWPRLNWKISPLSGSTDENLVMGCSFTCPMLQSLAAVKVGREGGYCYVQPAGTMGNTLDHSQLMLYTSIQGHTK